MKILQLLVKLLILSIVLWGVAGCDMITGVLDEDEDENNGGESVAAPPAEERVTDSAGNEYRVGYDQVSSNDQDPYVEKLNDAGDTLWRIRHDETPVDARAVFVALDDQERPYVVFTGDGGSNESDRFQTHRVEAGAFDDAPFRSYGSGGGAKVSVIARLDPATGDIEAGTYLIARLSNGSTNTISPTGLAVSGDAVRLSVDSAAWPPAAGADSGNWQRFDETRFNDESRPALLYTFPLDLSEIREVQVIE